MKRTSTLILVTGLLSAAFATQAEIVRGHFRSNGTYVMPYYRTPANGTPYDNLSYRGYPSQQPDYVSPHGHGYASPFGSGRKCVNDQPSWGLPRNRAPLLPDSWSTSSPSGGFVGSSSVWLE